MKQLLLIIMLIICIKGYTQNQSNIWYFGHNAGLDFNSGLPIVLTDGELNADEGCASISNTAGMLQFYTDGVTVYNSQHNIMPNGTGLLGENSSTQSAIILPKPCSPDIFYIFTVAQLAGEAGLRYSEVDISMDNGLGAVTTNKNILLTTPVCEKLTAVPKADGTGFWVLVHGFNNNQFMAFSVTSDGVSTSPVLSNSGSEITTEINTIGCLTPSHDGTKLVCSNYYLNTEIFNFDAVSGIVSNGQVLNVAPFGFGAEFSPSGNVLYISTGYSTVIDLIQYDLTASNIQASAVSLASSDNYFGALQLASNGKIYITKPYSSNLSAINNPDVLGIGCGYTDNAITFPNEIIWGLPQEILLTPDASIDISAQDVCLGNPILFGVSTCQPITSVNWNFGDGTTSIEMSPSHIYAIAGTYNVVVTAQIAGTSVEQTYEATVFDTPVANEIPDQTLCVDAGTIYDLTQNDAALWGLQNDDFFIRDYYGSLADAQAHINALGTNYTLIEGLNTFYAGVFNLENLTCYAIEIFTVNVTTAPVLPAVPNLQSCDSNYADGFAVFNLTQQDAILLAGQTGSTVAYYTSQTDAIAGTNPIVTPVNFTNTSNPQTVYVGVTTLTGCHSYTLFTVNVLATPKVVSLPPIEICDDSTADGFTTFNLTQQDAALLAGQTGVSITYYTSQAEADANSNAIPNPSAFTNTTTPQIIYARVSNTTCYAITSFIIMVKPMPVVDTPANVTACNSYTLPALSADNSYYTGPQATGTVLFAGNPILSNQTIYVHAVNGICSADSSFTIIITPTPMLNLDTPIAGACMGTDYILTAVFANQEDIYNIDNVDFKWTNIINETIILGTSYDLAITGKGTYHLVILPAGGSCPTEAFIEVGDTSCAIQKGISPGDANDNNYFDLSMLDIKRLSIFNRYGLEVYTCNNYKKEWGGQTNSGHELPTGTYFYMFERANGETKTGWIYINRQN